MNPESTRHICCPGCRSREGYRLSDGRRKCRRCGKKYTSRLFRSRLPAKTLKQLALYYWLAAPIACVARDLRLDAKTVRRHNELMQQGITAYGRRQCRMPNEFYGKEDFSLLVAAEAISVELSPAPSSANAALETLGYHWWYSEIMLFEAPFLRIGCQVLLTADAIRQDQHRWLGGLEKLAKIIQALYQKRKCRTTMARQLLLSEAAFRFNQRNNPGVSALLYDFLKARPR